MFLEELMMWYHTTPEDLAQIEEADFYDLVNEYPDLYESCVDFFTCDLA